MRNFDSAQAKEAWISQQAELIVTLQLSCLELAEDMQALSTSSLAYHLLYKCYLELEEQSAALNKEVLQYL